MAGLQVGAAIDDFTLPAYPRRDIALSSLSGKVLVLFFYPEDGSKSCTSEVIDFNSLAQAFEAAGIALYGVSPDSVAKHERFAKKHDLSVSLISDENHKAIAPFGLWVEKSMYGRSFMGVERATVLIDRQGKIVRVWHRVKVRGHAAEVLEAAKGLAST